MADVRAMLRSELASRNQQGGSLPTGRKRKANTEDTQRESTRTKRSRNADAEIVTMPEPEAQPRSKHAKRASQHVVLPPDLETVPEEVPVLPEQENVPDPQQQKDSTAAATPDDVDEAEWAAFERDIAEPEPTSAPLSALNAAATIEAKPLTAEQLAAQAREEESTQRGKRDLEAEEEKEDAQRQLEDEFDEMEAFEERVRKLKERREQLRRGSDSQTRDEASRSTIKIQRPDPPTVESTLEEQETRADGSDQSESESDADEWDPWTR